MTTRRIDRLAAALAATMLVCVVAAPVARAVDAGQPPEPDSSDAGVPADDAEPADAGTEPADDAEPEAQPAAPLDGTVEDVRFTGNRRIETAALLPMLATRIGKPLDAAGVRKDIKTLWDQKFFADVKVDVTDGDKGPIVTFLVEEKPLVREVRIEGNEEIGDEDLQKELEVKPFQIVDDGVVRKTAKKLQSKYVDKGFFLAEVTPRVVPVGDQNQVDVVFRVIERAKVEVRRISFQGNRAIGDEELKNNLGTQEKGLLSFITNQGTYKEEIFQRDLLVIQSLYYNRGYINVRVGRPAIALSPDKRFIAITIPIEEGEPYDFGEVTVGGDLLGEDEAVKALVTLKPGERFSSQSLQQNMLALQDFFRDRGYAYVQIAPATAVDVQSKSVAINFVATPGDKVTIERIEVVGNSKTRDKVIRREMRIAEGDIYNGAGIRNSKARVTALGFFEVVDVTSSQGSRPDTMVLEVSVKEKPTGTFQLGLGFSNQEPILFNANISQNNFLGWGTSVAFMAQWSRLRRIFSLSYTDPYCGDTRWTCAFDFYNTRQVYTDFDRTAFGGTLTGGYEIFEDLRFFATYTAQQVEAVSSSVAGTKLANQFRGGFTSSLKGSFNFDKRDNRLFPTNGLLLSGSVEFAGKPTFSQNEFVRWVGIARFYKGLGAGFVFKVNANVGWIQSPVENPVPVTELFFEGGINSLRGYNFRSISPTVLAGSTVSGPLTPVLVGGNKELLTNWELEFPILAEAGLRGVLFFDAGNVYAPGQRFFDPSAPGAAGLLMAVGLGARWFTPLGPLRFEYGIPLTPRPNDPPGRFEFTIGSFF